MPPSPSQPSTTEPAPQALFPIVFSTASPSPAASIYLADPLALDLLTFFEKKGLAALKEEDRNETWYADWLAYQSDRKLYARLLAPKEFSSLGSELNLLRITRFLELFGYCSAAHGYSLQVSFLGLFSILMGTNLELKREAVAALESGALFAFGISEQDHGSDLLGNSFAIHQPTPGQFIANGSKYYIGNANCAFMISVLSRNENDRSAGRSRRAPLVLFALRPDQGKRLKSIRKIKTLGVRAAFVGQFDVENYSFPATDLIAEGRQSWDAVFGTVTLGKFFLGFGAIGICQRALHEAVTHLTTRILYAKPAIEMRHLRSATAQAYARLTAMKLYAYRALDYVHAACENDRRYLLFAAVQKAEVSTDGVKVMAQLSDSIGAKGLESDTYFELALRDIQLIPGLEGSAHINLALTAQFLPNYFHNPNRSLAQPPSLIAGETAPTENPYLFNATHSALNTIRFPHYLAAFKPLKSNPNVRRFARQARTLRRLNRRLQAKRSDLLQDTEIAILLGRCLATIAYGQLIAESAGKLGLPAPVVNTIFHLLVNDLSTAALELSAFPTLPPRSRQIAQEMILTPKTLASDWDDLAARVSHLP